MHALHKIKLIFYRLIIDKDEISYIWIWNPSFLKTTYLRLCFPPCVSLSVFLNIYIKYLNFFLVFHICFFYSISSCVCIMLFGYKSFSVTETRNPMSPALFLVLYWIVHFSIFFFYKGVRIYF